MGPTVEVRAAASAFGLDRYGGDMDPIIVIAASAGGLDPLLRIVTALPSACPASVFVVQHIGSHPSLLPGILADRGRLPAGFAADREVIRYGRVYVAPPDHHMRLSRGEIRLDRGPKVHFARPAADPLLSSAAEAYGPRVIGIVLSGGGDGAEGLRALKAHGGLVLVQPPDEAAVPGMPLNALLRDHPDAFLSADRVAVLCADQR